MAVWIYAYGQNGLKSGTHYPLEDYVAILNNIDLDELKILDSIKEVLNDGVDREDWIRTHYAENRKRIEDSFRTKTVDEYKNYLNSIHLPYIDIDKIVDRFIEDGVQRERQKTAHFNNAYEQFKLGNVTSQWEIGEGNSVVNKMKYFEPYDGFRFSLLNDLIRISGPFSVFSIYGRFQTNISRESREYYHSYFKQIFKAFKSEFILYAHEWSGLDDEEDSDFNVSKLKEQSNWSKNSSTSIHTMDSFYYEEL